MSYLTNIKIKAVNALAACLLIVSYSAEAASSGSLLTMGLASRTQAIEKLVIEKKIKIPYSYIAQLMSLPNAFGEGEACTLCHSSSNSTVSYRGLDLSTCEGIKEGSTESPLRKIVMPGNSEEGLILRHLRNNRMPLGVPFDSPVDTQNILTIKKWIDDGAKNNTIFNSKVLPLFTQPDAFGGSVSCIQCHVPNPGLHYLDLTSHKGVINGVTRQTGWRDTLPVKVVIAGNSADSILFQRLVENRMPVGINPVENSEHPNLTILSSWLAQGANCD
ncbi:MAG: hypothetical protein HOM14_02000 [Gammaproteobacteria bacterium]|jgi:hypothetical protein|nr:hypothetical protein [Gammaproteobacteria bacterium]MBT3725024.1 hypothetical protein [Gammaproteobacteria bacterium]MBT4193852.1 hypothetical protein [Gammaproteobacteria bacterium]MBT4449735.1 hypothetical protein [Gammaproteobacteria bacterium]MBT4863289.1 hypothetical protein [Gammaproteobacteria bacterium]